MMNDQVTIGGNKMKRILMAALLIIAMSFAAHAENSFEKLKSLSGKWAGKDKDGNVVEVSYELISNGAAVMETLTGTGTRMTTIYHPDGSNVMLTHYCMANNAPRMRASTFDGSTLTFDLIDVANLASPEAGHMRGLIMKFPDPEHLSQQWIWFENGKEISNVMQYSKVK
jgi:hypothetical protein